MKRVRTAALVLCGAVLAVLPALTLHAVAQQDGGPPPPPPGQTQGPPPGGPHGRGGPERRIEALQQRLNLTPDQVTQVKAIFADGRAKAEALHSDQALSEDDRHMKMGQMMHEENAKIRTLLTPDQQTKFDAMQAHQRERMHGEPGPGDGPQPPPPPQ